MERYEVELEQPTLCSQNRQHSDIEAKQQPINTTGNCEVSRLENELFTYC